MRYITFFVLVIFTNVSAADVQSRVQQLAQSVIESGFRKPISQDEYSRTDAYFRSGHGPILKSGERFKYALEYRYEVVVKTNLRTHKKEVLSHELAIMELVYCNFKFQSAKDYRFRRRSYTFESTGGLDNSIEFIRRYHPSENTGNCAGGKESTVEERSFQPDVDEMFQLVTVLGELMK